MLRMRLIFEFADAVIIGVINKQLDSISRLSDHFFDGVRHLINISLVSYIVYAFGGDVLYKNFNLVLQRADVVSCSIVSAPLHLVDKKNRQKETFLVGDMRTLAYLIKGIAAFI